MRLSLKAPDMQSLWIGIEWPGQFTKRRIASLASLLFNSGQGPPHGITTVAVSPQHSTSLVLATELPTILTLFSVAVASEKNVANAATPTCPPAMSERDSVLLPS